MASAMLSHRWVPPKYAEFAVRSTLVASPVSSEMSISSSPRSEELPSVRASSFGRIAGAQGIDLVISTTVCRSAADFISG
jgi:hypothetical protein